MSSDLPDNYTHINDVFTEKQISKMELKKLPDEENLGWSARLSAVLTEKALDCLSEGKPLAFRGIDLNHLFNATEHSLIKILEINYGFKFHKMAHKVFEKTWPHTSISTEAHVLWYVVIDINDQFIYQRHEQKLLASHAWKMQFLFEQLRKNYPSVYLYDPFSDMSYYDDFIEEEYTNKDGETEFKEIPLFLWLAENVSVENLLNFQLIAPSLFMIHCEVFELLEHKSLLQIVFHLTLEKTDDEVIKNVISDFHQALQRKHGKEINLWPVINNSCRYLNIPSDKFTGVVSIQGIVDGTSDASLARHKIIQTLCNEHATESADVILKKLTDKVRYQRIKTRNEFWHLVRFYDIQLTNEQEEEIDSILTKHALP